MDLGWWNKPERIYSVLLKEVAAIHQGSSGSTFQTHDHFHLEGQGQQIHGNTTTCKFPSKPLTILTWKYIGCSFAVAGSKSWNSFPNSIVGQPTARGLQRFKKAAHHHLLKGN